MAGLPNARATPLSLPKRSGALSPFYALNRSRPRFAKWGLPHFSTQKAFFAPDRFGDNDFGGRKADGGGPGVSPGSPWGQPRSGGGVRFKSTGRHGRVASRHEKSPGRNGSDFRVWMTGLEPATSWSLTRCATNCATSRGPFFKGIANIGILFRKCKRAATYFSAGGVDRASCRAFKAAFRAEEAFRRRMGPLTQAKVYRSSFSSSGVKLG